MKKIVCVFLTVCLLVGTGMPAVTAAAADKCTCGHDPVIYVTGFGSPLYKQTDSGREQIYPPSDEAMEAQKETIIRAAVCLLFHLDKRFADIGMQVATDLLGDVTCNKEGVPQEGTGIYPEPVATGDVHGQMRRGNADYAFYYDWRLSPIDNAEKLHTYVQQIKRICRHDKVSLTCHSMGGTLLASYLYLYGSEDISHAIAIAPAWQGVSIMGSLLSGEARIIDKSRQLDLFLRSIPSIKDERLQTAIRFAGVLYPLVLTHLQITLTKQFKRVFDLCLRDMFGNMPGVWAFVPDRYYDTAKAFTFGDDPQYDVLRAKVDRYHYEVQNQLTELLQKAMDDGMQLTILSGYGISSMPLSKAHTVQSDILINTADTSIGATCAPFGKKLASGERLSPDKTVDASTCAFPEQTWFVRGIMHFPFPYESDAFVRWAVAQTEQPTVQTNPDYPQFLVWQEGVGFVPDR